MKNHIQHKMKKAGLDDSFRTDDSSSDNDNTKSALMLPGPAGTHRSGVIPSFAEKRSSAQEIEMAWNEAPKDSAELSGSRVNIEGKDRKASMV